METFFTLVGYWLSLIPGMPDGPLPRAGAVFGTVVALLILYRFIHRRTRVHKTDAMIFAAEAEVNIPPIKKL